MLGVGLSVSCSNIVGGWKERTVNFPKLSAELKHLFAIHASRAASERSFSAACTLCVALVRSLHGGVKIIRFVFTQSRCDQFNS
jgi:hAT family C-terminal dimerisation region